MSKNKKSTNNKKCVCNRCGAEAISIPDTTHRRCSGNSDSPNPVETGKNVASALRGKWQG